MSAEDKPIGRLEFELTDELLTRAASTVAKFELSRFKNKEIPSTYRWVLVTLAASLLYLGWTHFKKPFSSNPRFSATEVSIFEDWLPWVILGGAATMLLAMLFLGLWLRRVPRIVDAKRLESQFRLMSKLPHRRLSIAFFEDLCVTAWAPGLSRVFWSNLRQVVIGPGFWLLKLKTDRQFRCIPTELITAEIEALIRRKAGEVGAKVEEWAEPPTQVGRG